MEVDDDLVAGLQFSTPQLLETERTGSRAKAVLPILPAHRKWTSRLLAIFLNERGPQWAMKDSRRVSTARRLGPHYLSAVAEQECCPISMNGGK
jgi:hypothetical protein